MKANRPVPVPRRPVSCHLAVSGLAAIEFCCRGARRDGRSRPNGPGIRRMSVKIGAKVVSHGRCVTFQVAEVAVPRQMFADILSLIARLQAPPARARGALGRVRQATTPG